MATTIVNEGTTLLLDCAWKDDDGAAVTPTTANYRIDDAAGASILASTAITGLSTTNTIVVSAAQNAIRVAANSVEERVVTLAWTYGASRQGTDEYRYLLKNLTGMPLS